MRKISSRRLAGQTAARQHVRGDATSAVFLSPTAEASDSTETAPAAQDSRSSGVMPLTLCAGVEEACTLDLRPA